MNKEETVTARKRLLGRNLSIAYRNPVKIVRGEMQYLFDDEGRRYLDAYNNVAHVGHCHPRVVAAGVEQMRLLNTNTRYLHEHLVEYIERLAATLPPPLSVVYLVCSGSEANELALRLARAHTGREQVIVVDVAYHGNTNALIDLGPYKFNGPGGRWLVSTPHPVRGRLAFAADSGARLSAPAASNAACVCPTMSSRAPRSARTIACAKPRRVKRP